ncbi:mannitol dehydrogenase family protein [Actinotalea sp. K2]|uniref:mannitol dehydrogenase family protein n=1 Tax=Actinotalea sp. K2 TaxID=2939438 RepID=UPI0020172C51|nr:mannitol dehydrogenase family protein [Actinotalea sp. K2]MCL3859771.1 mannitol dehydrogenase family protein [Actinotalea sp. K2]
MSPTTPDGAALRRTAPAAPVRHVHLGLGNFFRAHQAWYTHRAADAGDWGIAAFTGRSPDLAVTMAAQDGLYTLDTRGRDGDHFEVVRSVVAAHAATDHGAWLRYLADPGVGIVTSTVTEAGYLRGADGGLDETRPAVQAEVRALRDDPTAGVRTAPGRLVAGLLARRRADAGPISVIPCDNLPENGAVVARVTRRFAELVDPSLVGWLDGNVGWVTTMVDRITPEPTEADRALIRAETGVDDRAPVVTEPFSEWVLSGELAAGSPGWAGAGAVVTDDIHPFEARKLGLLNGAHSLLAYAGPLRGHATVAEAVADDTCRGWVEEWWDEASTHLTLPAADVAAYRTALLERFGNPAIRHRLEQIAADGSQKVPVRILPTVRLERAAGRMPDGAARALAAWVLHLRGDGCAVTDPGAAGLVQQVSGPLPTAVHRVLSGLDGSLADDDALVAAVIEHAQALSRR